MKISAATSCATRPSAMASGSSPRSILFLAAVGGYLYWQNQQASQASADSEAMSAALDKVGSGNAKGAAAELGPLERIVERRDARNRLLGRASLAVQQSDRKTASDIYKQVADDEDLPQPFRDLATVRGTMVDFDSMKPDDGDRPAEAAGRARQAVVRLAPAN